MVTLPNYTDKSEWGWEAAGNIGKNKEESRHYKSTFSQHE